MLEEMGNQKERMQEILRRRLLELANAIEQLLQQQKQELAAAQAEQRDWPLLEERESALRRRTIAVEEQARGSSETQPAADPLALAVEAQGQAILAMRVRNANAVVTSEENAIEQLEEALRIIREKKQQMEEEEAREQREELRQQYEALAEREETLKGDVGALLEDGQLTRRERADIVQRAAEQSAIRDEAAALEEKVEQTLVFKALHERVADASDEAASTMQRGQADAALLRQQERVAIWLRTMAAALEEDQGEPSDFAEPEQPQDDQSGGGAGAGEQPPDMIPPIAELKLMRALQEVIYQQTRTADEIKPLNADEVRMLSDQQQELSDLGLQLIEKMQQQMQPMQPDDTDGKSRGEPGGTQ